MEKIVTVCTPTYNRANLLVRPYKSLMAQTNKNFTWLIIDDGSTDDTELVVKKFIQEADFEIEYIKKENGGRHTALNLSYDYINTDFVINLDSDDELLPTCIERLSTHIENLRGGGYKIYGKLLVYV